VAFSVLRPAAVLLAVGVVAGVHFGGGSSPPKAAAPPVLQSRMGLDASSDAQARIMRRATRVRADELSVASRCKDQGFTECTAPALRHAAMSGRTTAVLLHVVVARIPAGECRNYLFRIGAASDAAGDQARWLMANIAANHRHVAGQIAMAAQMLEHAWRAARADVCAPKATGPAA
jgi:hypothetical protein